MIPTHPYVRYIDRIANCTKACATEMILETLLSCSDDVIAAVSLSQGNHWQRACSTIFDQYWNSSNFPRVTDSLTVLIEHHKCLAISI